MEVGSHVAGHCHTARDAETGVLVHIHGPHTFNSGEDSAWEYAQRFSRFYPYRHEKFAVVKGRQYELPINLNTLRQFFGRNFSSGEAKSFLSAQAVNLDHAPNNFEEAAIATVGRALYEAFYRGYTLKQWGRDPATLPARIFGRVPIRFDEDRNYFHYVRARSAHRWLHRTRGENAEAPANHGSAGSLFQF